MMDAEIAGVCHVEKYLAYQFREPVWVACK
jgi:hypothetical protein